ncbi:MAG TPA: TlpA disulfide reductase family protein [Pirellulales bacterium]|nr:TlpA disulfide reductase family protein [Pirellulales bacterium]
MSHLLRQGRFFLALIVATAAASVVPCRAADEAEKPKSAKTSAGAKAEKVPDGSPKELLVYIKKLQATEPKGSTRAARTDDTRRIQKDIIAAAEKVAAAKPDEATAAAALRAELEALAKLDSLGDAGAVEKRDALVAKFENDKRPAIASIVDYFRLAKAAADLDVSEKEDVKAFIAQSMDFISKTKLDFSMLPLANTVFQLAQRTQEGEELAQTARKLAVRLAESDDPRVANYAPTVISLSAELYQKDDKNDEAIECYQEVAKLLANSENDEISRSAEKLEGAIRQLKLIGSPIEIKGKLVDGKKFDWAKFKGKVVLVDFWATWCGPCIEELPNVKEVYEKYHDQGFDVVGISLDDDREALEAFLDREHIRWPILFSDDPAATGWDHPMATYFGISSVPATILVDRQGKVVTLSAHGERLGELVAELIEAKAGK